MIFEIFIENINDKIIVFYGDDFNTIVMPSIKDKIEENYLSENCSNF